MNDLSRALLSWYDRHARVLPWRNIRDPYRTWVSETMLQQTRVETVIPYYRRFLERFPTLAALAEAEEADVLKVWQGLGYYSRARNLLRGARQVMAQYGGTLPSDPAELVRISGIGAYTAGAIASIAFDQPVPAVDGNVIRVLSRIDGLREDVSLPENRKRIESLAASLVPPERPGDHNQALMDLGAGLCVPGTPDCRRCPLAGFCDAFRAGDAADLPVLPKAKPPRVLYWHLILVLSGSRVLMRCRTEKLLEGLWCFPMAECGPEENDPAAWIQKKLRLSPESISPAGFGRHVFTHQVWQMRIWSCRVPTDAAAPVGWQFVDLNELSELPLPVAMEPALDCLKKLLNQEESPV